MEVLSRNTRSAFGRLDVRLKLGIGFSMSVLAVLADSLVLLATLLFIGVVVFWLSRPNRSQVRLVTWLCLLLVWGLMFSQAIFYDRFPREALFTVLQPNWLLPDGLCIYRQGIEYGALQSFRMLAIGLVGYAVCFSTEPDEFLGGLIAYKVPFSLAFMAVSAIQFVPVLAAEAQQIRGAMRLKGYRPLRRGIGRTVRTEIGALRSVLAGTIRRSEEKALSILTRGFDLDSPRTFLYREPLKPAQWAAGLALLVAVLALASVKILFWLYQHQIYSASELRALYGFARAWL